jgi:hypothetical protein
MGSFTLADTVSILQKYGVHPIHKKGALDNLFERVELAPDPDPSMRREKACALFPS